VRLTPQFLRALHLELFTRSSALPLRYAYIILQGH
jgi:hypothetical protein